MSILDDIDVQIDRFDKLVEDICNIIVDKYDCATPEFVQDVRCVYLNKVMPSIRDMVNSHWLIKSHECVINDIPIHFGRQEDYENYDDGKYLGLYRRTTNNQREIVLFEYAIKKVVEVFGCDLDNLIWKVIMHEYAHVIMDTMQHDDKLRERDSKLYKYREESLANAFALRTLKSEENYFGKIKEFVDSQSEEYKHGLNLYESEDLFKMMEFWREMKIEGNKRF